MKPAGFDGSVEGGGTRRGKPRGWLIPLLFVAIVLGGILGGWMVWTWSDSPGSMFSESGSREGQGAPQVLTTREAEAAPSSAGGTTPANGIPADPSEANTVAVVEASLPGVVQVRVQGLHPGLDWSVPIQGGGSGFLYDGQGHVITNNHVVEDSKSVEVVFPDGEVFQAEVVGTDRLSDLAVVRVKSFNRSSTPLPLGDSSRVRVGQKAIAIGSPMGDQDGQRLGLNRTPTVTVGIVSAVDRSMPVMSKRNPQVQDFVIEGLIQTDAAINPGNSGGPLLNSSGEVIGVNTAIVASAQGIGFAIPSDVVRSIVPKLIAGGSVDRPYLGIIFQDLELVRGSLESGIPLPESGVVVIEVDPDSPAAAAGVRGSLPVTSEAGDSGSLGDIILAVNGKSVDGKSLQAEILKYQPGDVVTLSIYRSGRTLDLQVTLARRK